MILPVVLHGCESWRFTLRVENRLRMSENRVEWRICGPKEIAGRAEKIA
jgi:hypothetical protein